MRVFFQLVLLAVAAVHECNSKTVPQTDDVKWGELPRSALANVMRHMDKETFMALEPAARLHASDPAITAGIFVNTYASDAAFNLFRSDQYSIRPYEITMNTVRPSNASLHAALNVAIRHRRFDLVQAWIELYGAEVDRNEIKANVYCASAWAGHTDAVEFIEGLLGVLDDPRIWDRMFVIAAQNAHVAYLDWMRMRRGKRIALASTMDEFASWATRNASIGATLIDQVLSGAFGAPPGEYGVRRAFFGAMEAGNVVGMLAVKSRVMASPFDREFMMTAMESAMANGHDKVAEEFLGAPGLSDRFINGCFQLATLVGRHAVRNWVVKHHRAVLSNGDLTRHFLIQGALTGVIATLQRAFEFGVPAQDALNEALGYALANQHRFVVDYLLNWAPRKAHPINDRWKFWRSSMNGFAIAIVTAIRSNNMHRASELLETYQPNRQEKDAIFAAGYTRPDFISRHGIVPSQQGIDSAFAYARFNLTRLTMLLKYAYRPSVDAIDDAYGALNPGMHEVFVRLNSFQLKPSFRVLYSATRHYAFTNDVDFNFLAIVDAQKVKMAIRNCLYELGDTPSAVHRLNHLRTYLPE